PTLAQCIKAESPMAPERALAIAFQVADALNASHQRGIVHRDLKPDNVILLRQRDHEFVKVLDFGIAKLTNDREPNSRRTRTGVVMGTPQYMSPEQCDGAGHIDHRTDVYALGILLFEMLTGQVPFRGEGYGMVLALHLTQPPPLPSSITPAIPPHVEAMVLKALEKNPNARYPSMQEFMQALSDPVGYVDSHGGIAAFLAATPSSVPGIPLSQPSMAGLRSGSHHALTPVPSIAPSVPGTPPSTLPGSMPGSMPGLPPSYHDGAQVAQTDGGSRLGLIAAVALVVMVLSVGGYFLLFTGGEGPAQAVVDPPASPVAEDSPDTPAEPEKPETADEPPTPAGGTAGAEPPDTPSDDGPENPAIEAVDPAADDRGEPAAVMVTIKLISNPAGAEVFVDDEGQPRGTTPFSFEVEKGSDPVTIALKREGYQTKTSRVTPDKNKEFDWQLKSRSRRGRDATSRKRDRTRPA
ncbi:MAG: protein kinase, partial [Myxococcota bacterium]